MKPHAARENESRQDPVPTVRSLVAATVAVMAVYAYFLIFAQFGFLRALTAALGEGHALLRPVMGVMGAAGIAGSIATVKCWREERARGAVQVGFLVAGLAAGLGWSAQTPSMFFVTATLTGLGTGIITVGLAAMMRRETGGKRLGLCLGVGTGSAYALCNLPPVFTAGPQVQAGLGLAAACLGLVAVQGLVQRMPVPAAGGSDYETLGIARWTVILLSLVVFDSAVFYLVQHTPGLKAATWTNHPQLWLNAGAHLAAGILAGGMLDRRRMAGATLAAVALLLAAAVLIVSGHGAFGAPLYAAGVSVYSTVLVFYPARRGRVGLAALVYAVAGWTGSALGIGAAEQFGWIPGWLPVLVVVPGLLLFRRGDVQSFSR